MACDAEAVASVFSAQTWLPGVDRRGKVWLRVDAAVERESPEAGVGAELEAGSHEAAQVVGRTGPQLLALDHVLQDLLGEGVLAHQISYKARGVGALRRGQLPFSCVTLCTVSDNAHEVGVPAALRQRLPHRAGRQAVAGVDGVKARLPRHLGERLGRARWPARRAPRSRPARRGAPGGPLRKCV